MSSVPLLLMTVQNSFNPMCSFLKTAPRYVFTFYSMSDCSLTSYHGGFHVNFIWCNHPFKITHRILLVHCFLSDVRVQVSALGLIGSLVLLIYWTPTFLYILAMYKYSYKSVKRKYVQNQKHEYTRAWRYILIYIYIYKYIKCVWSKMWAYTLAKRTQSSPLEIKAFGLSR